MDHDHTKGGGEHQSSESSNRGGEKQPHTIAARTPTKAPFKRPTNHNIGSHNSVNVRNLAPSRECIVAHSCQSSCLWFLPLSISIDRLCTYFPVSILHHSYVIIHSQSSSPRSSSGAVTPVALSKPNRSPGGQVRLFICLSIYIYLLTGSALPRSYVMIHSQWSTPRPSSGVATTIAQSKPNLSPGGQVSSYIYLSIDWYLLFLVLM